MKNLKFNNNLLYLIIAVIVVLMLIFAQRREVEVVEEVEESVGSGFLEIETSPSDAEIFMDGDYKGKSPITLNNIPSGTHNIVIKKEGYDDFIKEVSVEAGRRVVLEARLGLIQAIEQVDVIEIIEDTSEILGIVEEDKIEEETLTGDLKSSVIVNIGEKFTLYYDFSEEEFVGNRKSDQDVFSKRFDNYIVFTRFSPVNIKTIDKNIANVQKEDCIGIKGQFEYLYSGQSLCVITKENEIVAIGGNWEDTKNAELKWKVFS